VNLNVANGPRAGIATIEKKMIESDEFFLRVLELAIENVHLGYDFQHEEGAVDRLNRTLTEAGSAWRVDVREEDAGQDWQGHKTFQVIRTLQRRIPDAANLASRRLSEIGNVPGIHLGRAWNHAFSRSPNPS
jgi:hypothetical protein